MAAAQLVSRVIIGMAGHVDHGKSALVTALTGQPMDRLAEEGKRGITIDLNFATIELAPGVTTGVIDVPGHEDLVRTMVAGASGVDMALLVIAADDGIMPQTREHLMVLEQLQVPAAIAVLTKSDTVEPEWLALVQAEVADWLASSSLTFGDPIVTSARTGAGIEELRSQLAGIATSLPPRDAEDLFRMPIDRVFSVAGTGTVVTGTATSGRAATGDLARVLPSGREVRLRSIESHGVALGHSSPGTRTAFALSGAEREEISRGDVLVRTADAWEPTNRLDAELSLAVQATQPLVDRARVRVHLGTAEVMARVRIDAALSPGSSAVVRLNLEAPLVARGGDRLVLRTFSPVTVIGGGWVVDPLPESRRRVPAGLASRDPAVRLEALVGRRRHGVAVRLLPMLLGLSPAACTALLQRSIELTAVGGTVVRRELIERLVTSLVEQVALFHRQEPFVPGVSLETLRRAVPATEPVVEAVLTAALDSGRIKLVSGLAARPGFHPVVRVSEADLDRLLAAVREGGLMASGVAELAGRLCLPEAEAGLRQAALAGDVRLVEPGRYVATEALESFARELREIGSSGEITPAAVRERTGLSRKYLIPLLEWSDRCGITRRVGDRRHLRAPSGGVVRGA